MKTTIINMSLILSFLLSSIVKADNNSVYSTYVCFNNNGYKSNPIGSISLGRSTNLAIFQMSNFQFTGTYFHHRPRCPSRLCDSETLEIHATQSKSNASEFDAMNAFFDFSPSRALQGQINVFITNELVNHFDAICELQ